MNFSQKLRELIGKATVQPWAIDPDDRPGMHWNNHIISAIRRHLTICVMTHDDTPENAECQTNAELIVYLVNHASALTDLVEAARKEIGVLEGNGFQDQVKRTRKALAALDKVPHG